MPRNKKEEWIFSLLMGGLMALGMSSYNIILSQGFRSDDISIIAAGFLPTLAIVIILEKLFVGALTKKFAFKLPINPEKRRHVILAMAACTIAQMVPIMSLYGLIMRDGLGGITTASAYFTELGFNLLMAIPLQILIVGPISRTILRRIQGIPVGTPH